MRDREIERGGRGRRKEMGEETRKRKLRDERKKKNDVAKKKKVFSLKSPFPFPTMAKGCSSPHAQHRLDDSSKDHTAAARKTAEAHVHE